MEQADGTPLATRAPLFGRSKELAQLQRSCSAEGPRVLFLTGMPGIGKSALLQRFAVEAKREGHTVVLLDCRGVEPTPQGFESALAPFAERLEGPHVLCLDHFDHFLLLDTWLRRSLADPALQDRRLILSGCHPPNVAWAAGGLGLRRLHLDVLPEQASRELLQSLDVPGAQVEGILAFTQGHPLALHLAAAGGSQTAEPGPRGVAAPQVIQVLTRFFLEGIEDPQLHDAIEAASIVRRVTRPLLARMLDRGIDVPFFDALAELPLVVPRRDGISLHPTVLAAVHGRLRARDPELLNLYRRRAWEALQESDAALPPRDLWRFTADVIYLLDDPVVREAFFPSGGPQVAVEPMRPADAECLHASIRSMPDAEASCLQHWMTSYPEHVKVVRDAQDSVQGAYLAFDPADVAETDLQADPLTRAWLAHLPVSHRRTPHQVLFLRRWFDLQGTDAPSPIQAACWLDIKRAYLQGRPHLRRVYLGVSALDPYVTVATRLGFAPLPATDGIPTASAVLDFGPGSVDAWLGGLVRRHLGLDREAVLDEDTRTLHLAGKPFPLTPREFEVTALLLQAAGRTVDRDVLLAEVWEGGLSVGSNVVDVLIRGLRRKLGEAALHVETVRGRGYRWKD